jgi:hypothetical protein
MLSSGRFAPTPDEIQKMVVASVKHGQGDIFEFLRRRFPGAVLKDEKLLIAAAASSLQVVDMLLESFEWSAREYVRILIHASKREKYFFLTLVGRARLTPAQASGVILHLCKTEKAHFLKDVLPVTGILPEVARLSRVRPWMKKLARAGAGTDKAVACENFLYLTALCDAGWDPVSVSAGALEQVRSGDMLGWLAARGVPPARLTICAKRLAEKGDLVSLRRLLAMGCDARELGAAAWGAMKHNSFGRAAAAEMMRFAMEFRPATIPAFSEIAPLMLRHEASRGHWEVCEMLARVCEDALDHADMMFCSGVAHADLVRWLMRWLEKSGARLREPQTAANRLRLQELAGGLSQDALVVGAKCLLKFGHALFEDVEYDFRDLCQSCGVPTQHRLIIGGLQRLVPETLPRRFRKQDIVAAAARMLRERVLTAVLGGRRRYGRRGTLFPQLWLWLYEEFVEIQYIAQ